MDAFIETETYSLCEFPWIALVNILDHVSCEDMLSLRATCKQMQESVDSYTKIPRVCNRLRTTITSVLDAAEIAIAPPDFRVAELDIDLERDETQTFYQLDMHGYLCQNSQHINSLRLNWFFSLQFSAEHSFLDSLANLKTLVIEEVRVCDSAKPYRILPKGLTTVATFSSKWSNSYKKINLFRDSSFTPAVIQFVHGHYDTESRNCFLQTIVEHLNLRNQSSARKPKVLDICTELLGFGGETGQQQLAEFASLCAEMDIVIFKSTELFLYQIERRIAKSDFLKFVNLIVHLKGLHPLMFTRNLPNLVSVKFKYQQTDGNVDRRWDDVDLNSFVFSKVRKIKGSINLDNNNIRANLSAEKALLLRWLKLANGSTCPNIQECRIRIFKPNWYPIPFVSYNLFSTLTQLLRLELDIDLSSEEIKALFLALMSTPIKSICLRNVNLADESMGGNDLVDSFFLEIKCKYGFVALKSFIVKTQSPCTACMLTDKTFEILSRSSLTSIVFNCTVPLVTPEGILNLFNSEHTRSSLQSFEFDLPTSSTQLLEAYNTVKEMCLKNNSSNEDS